MWVTFFLEETSAKKIIFSRYQAQDEPAVELPRELNSAELVNLVLEKASIDIAELRWKGAVKVNLRLVIFDDFPSNHGYPGDVRRTSFLDIRDVRGISMNVRRTSEGRPWEIQRVLNKNMQDCEILAALTTSRSVPLSQEVRVSAITVKNAGGQVIPEVEKIRVLGLLIQRNRVNGETVNKRAGKAAAPMRLIQPD
ncbi:uncharacterized protein [Dermacentor albipictus]|uniref:uncharacterized protein isoform X1 n=1 Tax=Dermacentor albipictus TaxID=60249 RepID=UPI0038FD3F34